MTLPPAPLIPPEAPKPSRKALWNSYPLSLVAERLAVILFSRMGALSLAVASLLVFSILVQMAEGATFGLVPFINPKAIGSVAGIVGAGGNVGAVAAGFLFRTEGIAFEDAFFILGIAIVAAAGSALLLRFPKPAVSVEPAVEVEPPATAHLPLLPTHRPVVYVGAHRGPGA